MQEQAAGDKGLIFNLQRFSIQDGPGIRTTVFFKGCPLRCPWCSNPESIRPHPEILSRDIKCIRCGKCVEVCDQKAANISAQPRIILRDKCDSCMACAEACPAHAIERTGEYKTVDEIIKVVLKDLSLYQRTGGGLTLSGGEPLMQAQFAASLLRPAKHANMHTALDTTGFAEWPALAEVLRHTDLVLYDLKQIDDLKHLQATGISNQLILKNLRRIMAETRVAVWIRIPVIPGFNDTEGDIRSICEFVQQLPRQPEKISLLPFHKFGAAKYIALGKIYPWNDAVLIPDQQMESFKRMVESCGFSADIGA